MDKTYMPKRIGARILPWLVTDGEPPDTRWENWDAPELDSPRGTRYVRADIADSLLAALKASNDWIPSDTALHRENANVIALTEGE